MKKLFLLSLLALAGVTHAEEYSCKVYCNSGTTNVTVNANSKEDAAAKVDKQGDQICRGENKGNGSNQTMRPDQCSRK